MAGPLDILQKYWGYTSFRPLQADIIEAVLNGHDALGLLPTGGGKSLTFQVPAMMLEGLTIVVTPLVSLMKDQVDNLALHDIKAIALHAGLTGSEVRLTFDKCRLGKIKLLYLAPERLVTENFLIEMRTWHVSLIVVDEAHCISQWGYDFRPSYLNIKVLRGMFPHAPVLALTASATPQVVGDIINKLEMRQPRVFTKSFSRANISFLVRRGPDKPSTLIKILRNTTGSAIVYVRSRARTSEYAKLLTDAGISADFYHAGLEVQEKNIKQNLWREDRIRVLVATTAFGMGIDKADVRVVVHVDIPSSLEEYYQEAGRAGRDGKPAFAVVLADERDKATLMRRVSDSFPPKDFIIHLYDEVAVYLDLAMGEGGGQTFEFNLEKFCVLRHQPPIMADSALALMTRMGWLEYTGEISTRSRVMMLLPKRELYSVQLSARAEAVLEALLRLYPGLYADYVPVNENTIGIACHHSEQDVYEALIELRRQHVLQFVPHRKTPYIYYPTRRQESHTLVIAKAIYDDRRAQMLERIQAMCDYVYNTDGCRVQGMLKYFGQESEPCGKCDWCREQKLSTSDHFNSDDIRRRMLHIARHAEGTELNDLVYQLNISGTEAERTRVIEEIREMLDRGKLVRLTNGHLRSKKAP